MKRRIYVVGGGTFNHVRPHMALCAPAFGATARQIMELVGQQDCNTLSTQYDVIPVFTKMADHNSNIVTNEDMAKWIDRIVADPLTRAVIFNAAIADYHGSVDGVMGGSKGRDRLETSNGTISMEMTPSDKLIGNIRKVRKDIFVVGFKATAGADSDTQYAKGLRLLKNNSLNLVVANDVVTHNCMIIVPEEARYAETTDRMFVLKQLLQITEARLGNTFTRSTVIEGESVDWNGSEVPDNLRKVVNFCVERGAYKPFLGKTVGHFAAKLTDTEIITSKRKTNFNNLDQVGLVRIESTGPDSVIAHGAKPSVGGQSQRIIFSDHTDVDCVAHFHCPMKEDRQDDIPVAPQWQNECGSHECGQNTSTNLKEFDLGDGDKLKVVFLEEHGPNIVFSRDTNPDKVINFIQANFDLSDKTGGMVNRYETRPQH